MNNFLLDHLKKSIHAYLYVSGENITTFCKNNGMNSYLLKEVFAGRKTITLRKADVLLDYIEKKQSKNG